MHLLICTKVSTRLIDDLVFWPSEEKTTKTSMKEHCILRMVKPGKKLKSKRQIIIMNIVTG